MTDRPIHDIATDIRKDWKKVNFAAVPYLRAMMTLTHEWEDYGADSARSVILYFLSNAREWRGPKARAIKAELRGMLK